jgi:NADPH2:quinone reductase
MDKLPTHMTAVAISKPGGPEVLIPEQRPVPLPGPHQILIKVAAAGVNRPDVAQRSGAYPPPPDASDLPGLEVAGEVVALGEGVTKRKIGDKVMSLVAGGGYAEYCLTHETHAIPVPANFSMIEAAATPETLMTVWHNVFERGGLKAGETLLVHGGSSGIGTTAIQINYKTEDFVAKVKELTGGVGVNVILDMIGGDYVDRNYDAAAVEGRIVQIAVLSTPKASPNFGKLMVKRLHHTGSTLRPRSVQDKAAMVAAITKTVLPWIAEGRFKPVMDSTFPLKDASKAHARMESSQHIGKIVLVV